MDEVEILKEVLNGTLQRHNRLSAAYEVEIANMTAEIVRLRSIVSGFEAAIAENSEIPEKTVKTAPAKS